MSFKIIEIHSNKLNTFQKGLSQQPVKQHQSQ